MPPLRHAIGIVATFAGFLLALPAHAEPVDVELVLAADGSGSIDDDELALQRQGYADAVTSKEVLDVIRAGYRGAIAITYVEWGSAASQHTIVDWTVIRDEASARDFADRLVSTPRAAFGYNSISAAIDYSVNKIETNDIEGAKAVIDVSGDGPNIGGRPVQAARDDAVRRGITVNGLVIQRPGGFSSAMGGEDLVEHYKRDVTGGLGAFVMVVDETTTFGTAVRRKMVQEIAQALGAPDSLTPTALD
ncbi:hypothetical protein HDIA_0037 [Hartmannibacter diazotrophicus]|uniref:VWFA domain-containing protein n=1 Tax=Hartmannibacter diazotrophicus TaxID=1482074 RepID=A0A2C9D085_9HYPH|nr:DUF1194 domain-containing protein [Hartmannibacter diazotrophicus]SON53578.1 hypothetical protein HDIA_0037 [Hartmannibacter diazotrophicus]